MSGLLSRLFGKEQEWSTPAEELRARVKERECLQEMIASFRALGFEADAKESEAELHSLDLRIRELESQV